MVVDQVRRGCFALALVVSLAVLFSPAAAVPTAPPGTDIAVHLAVFVALAYTSVLAGLPLSAAAVTLPAYGALSELVQASPVLGRSASLVDWAFDLMGVGLGLALALAVRRTGRWWAPDPTRSGSGGPVPPA